MDERGPYRIITENGTEVALFSNGSRAPFTIDEEYVPPTGQGPKQLRKPKPKAAPVVEKVEPKPEPEPILKTPHNSTTIAVFRHRGNVRPPALSDSLYCVMHEGKPQFNATIAETGTGLREYLWLYERLRLYGRGRIGAAIEAFQLYRLAQ